MKILQTERLTINVLKEKDKKLFFELLTKPEIINPIPQNELTEKEILEKFEECLKVKNVLALNKTVCGIFEKNNFELIGLALFLKNEEDDIELGYRFRTEFWGKGYGTETAKGMIDYYFKKLNVNKVTADVNIENNGSVKILNKFMKPVKEYYHERDKCTNRRYLVEKENWL